MDILYEPINDIYEYSEHMTPESLEIGKKAGDKHWEQIAILSGDIQVGEQNYIIENALGQRDHTFGVRDWTGVGNWLYYVVWFNENLAINPAAIITDDNRLSTGGFIFKNGKNIQVNGFKYETENEDIVIIDGALSKNIKFDSADFKDTLTDIKQKDSVPEDAVSIQ